MKLADRYSTERLEAACNRALSYTPNPSLKNISTILKNGQDKAQAKPAVSDLQGYWAKIHIETMLERGIMGGYPDGAPVVQGSPWQQFSVRKASSAFICAKSAR